MLGDLISGFDFSFFDENQKRHTLRSSGVFRESSRSDQPWIFGVWLTIPPGIPHLNEGSLRVEYQHPVGTFSGRTDEERTKLGYQFGALFCTFVQGAVLGWDVVQHNLEVLRERRDQISVNDYVSRNELSPFQMELGLDQAGARRHLRDDLLAFALENYESRGATHPWNLDAFRGSGFSRFPSAVRLAEGVFGDLRLEKKLVGPRGEVDVWLAPGFRDDCVKYCRVVREERLDRLRNIGLQRGWSKLESQTKGVTVARAPSGQPRVFIIHGHDEAKRRELKELLENRFGLEVVIMQEQAGQSRTLIEKFEDEAQQCNAAIALLTPDDVITEKDEGQPRPNVMFELGWFAGKYGRSRTLMIVREGTRIPSDLYGIEVIPFAKAISEKIPDLEREIEVWKRGQPDLPVGDSSLGTRDATGQRDDVADTAAEILEAAASADGRIMMARSSGGMTICAGEQTLFQGKDERVIARHKAALEQLVNDGKVEPRGERGEIFAVTHEGYQSIG